MEKGTDTAEEAVPAGENADGTKNYRAVVTATPTGSLKFTDEIMPKMLKVNVDGTHIKTVPITDAKLNDNGTMEVSYSLKNVYRRQSENGLCYRLQQDLYAFRI